MFRRPYPGCILAQMHTCSTTSVHMYRIAMFYCSYTSCLCVAHPRPSLFWLFSFFPAISSLHPYPSIHTSPSLFSSRYLHIDKCACSSSPSSARPFVCPPTYCSFCVSNHVPPVFQSRTLVFFHVTLLHVRSFVYLSYLSTTLSLHNLLAVFPLTPERFTYLSMWKSSHYLIHRLVHPRKHSTRTLTVCAVERRWSETSNVLDVRLVARSQSKFRGPTY